MSATSTNDAELRIIEDALSSRFDRDSITSYRYNPASLRVRIIDPRFSELSIPAREALVLPLIRTLPQEIQADITVLLLLAPEDVPMSTMNREFENPRRSRL